MSADDRASPRELPRRARDAALRFALQGDLVEVAAYGTGHINTTFIVTMDQAGARVRYLLQLLNTSVFREPELLMDNIVRITGHLRRRMMAAGADSISRRALTVVPALDGRCYWCDSEEGFWRCYLFIEGAYSSDHIDSPGKAFALGEASGRFLELVSDLPGPRLAETIPDFHNARTRMASFERAVVEDRAGRVATVGSEIEFFRSKGRGFDRIVEALEAGELPERITHNDTKISNLLIDDATDEAICVIDLDTVMPGAAAYDFGDLARTVPASTVEDDPVPEKMSLVPPMFKALVRGFAAGTRRAQGGSFLTEREIKLLPLGAPVMTMLMGIRFLTDYLDGDRYYRIARVSHNLDRSRTQISLIRSLDAQRGMLEETVAAAFETLSRGR
ncbi:MAG: aminoglycoside phosphotransferase family protein [Spirochaetota bacterium]